MSFETVTNLQLLDDLLLQPSERELEAFPQCFVGVFSGGSWTTATAVQRFLVSINQLINEGHVLALQSVCYRTFVKMLKL